MAVSLFLLFASVALIGSALGSYYDLKTSEIPDKVPIGISLMGLILYILDFFINKNTFPFVSIISVCGFFLVCGYVLFWLAQWGEADVLILVSLGVLLPYLFSIPNNFHSAMMFAGVFMGISFAVGGIYSVVFSIIIMVKNKKTNAFAKYILKEKNQLHSIFCFLILGTVLYIYACLKQMHYLELLTVELLVFIPFFYMLIKFAKFADEFVYRKKIKTTELVEGDVIAQKIKELKINGKRYEGIVEEDVKKIKKILKYVYVKDGVRYAPVFFLTILLFLAIWKSYLAMYFPV
ncbi:MAG: hypothetical protein DRN66_02515 [Candidatus Nanohalarchaeota archaeon]|nr:MAG: hypothetical protein DRN66_02515 [Candidatus Nanohaloarchaeota archaeon]